MHKLLIATTNKGKFAEIRRFLRDLNLECVSLSDLSITHDVEENGSTYEENSKKKALEYAALSGLPAISDDGGFEIQALDGAPGVKSKRWVGDGISEQAIVDKMIELSKNLPKDTRSAKFVAIETLALPSGKYWQVRSEIEGIIPEQPQYPIPHGLPYRSFFFLPQIKKYYLESELTSEETKAYNHRYRAIQQLKPIIEKEIA